MQFADTVRAKLEADPDLRKKHRRIYRILTGPDTPQRQRWLRAVAHTYRMQQNIPDGMEIDLSQIDWVKLFKIMVSLLGLLMLFI